MKRIIKRSNYWYADFRYNGVRFRNKLHNDKNIAQLLAEKLVTDYQLSQLGANDQIEEPESYRGHKDFGLVG